jgi:hypothetical protein
MAITTAMAGSFKKELMKGKHCFTTTGFTLTGTASSTVNYTSVASGTGTSADLMPGMTFTGTNVGTNSVVTAIVSSTAFTSSVASTGAISGGTLTFTNPMATSYKLALFTSTATMDGTTATYNTSNEASGTNYTAGGSALTFSASMPSLTSTTAWMDFADLPFSTVTITARGCQIYNSYAGLNQSVSVHDFGADKSASAGDFTIIFPAADSSNAILRLA